MAECRSETSFKSYTFSFEWTVNNLDARLENPCKLTSPEFSSPAGAKPPTKWQLAVFLHPDERSSDAATDRNTIPKFSNVFALQGGSAQLAGMVPGFSRPFGSGSIGGFNLQQTAVQTEWSVQQYIGIEAKRRRAGDSTTPATTALTSPSGVHNKTDKQADQDEEGIWTEAKLQPPKVNKKTFSSASMPLLTSFTVNEDSSSAGKEVASSLGPMKLYFSGKSGTSQQSAAKLSDNMIFKHVLPRSEVQNSHSVVFNCQITVWSLDSPKHEKHTSLQPTALGSPEFNLSNIMKEARKNGHFTDVTLVVAGEKEFKAHKVVLATQSQFFKTKFESRWSSGAGQQHCNNRIEMTDVPANVMEAVLSYMYTGTVTNGIDEIATETLTTAEDYGLEGLRRMCEASLAKTLTSESVVDMLIFADNHNAVDLRKECIKYISSNASIVRNSEGWKKLNDPNIYQRFGFEILEAIAKRV